MKQVRGALVGRVQDFSGASSRGVHRSGVKQTVTTTQKRRPAVGVEDISLNEFQPVFAFEVGCMGDDMGCFFGVIEVPHRPAHGVAVFEQVPNDVIPNVTVDARNEDAFWRFIGHTAGDTRVPYEPSSATRRHAVLSPCPFVCTTPAVAKR